jgi:hypothetical protein
VVSATDPQGCILESLDRIPNRIGNNKVPKTSQLLINFLIWSGYDQTLSFLVVRRIVVATYSLLLVTNNSLFLNLWLKIFLTLALD